MKNKNLNLKWVLLGTFLLISRFGWTQAEQAQKGGSDFFTFVYHNPLLILGFAVVIGAFFSIFYLISVMFQVQKMRMLQEHGMEAMAEQKIIKRDPLWKRLYQRWTAVVPIEKEKDILLSHNYDGIRELDNKLPPWWVAVFYFTIAFGVVYLIANHWSSGAMSSQDQYVAEMENAQEAIKVYLSKQADLVDETNATMINDEDQLALGQQVFETNCVVCHGQQGQGASVGPNLADPFWIHGGGVKNIFKTVKYGVPEKGMIPWKTQLRAKDIHRVSSYIWSLQGTNPADPKEPEGELYTPEASISTDSLSESAGEMTGMNEQ